MADVAADVSWRVRLPLECGVLSLFPPARSQDAQAADTPLVDELCVICPPLRVLMPMPWRVWRDVWSVFFGGGGIHEYFLGEFMKNISA